ncbi:MAG: 2-C-methyl-D-erythritol 4-phosphate cytidylyltransferase [Spongiibacter sp.]|nr:2-C-methyl-D-erythritol 4-phosphate cytidylyltransferase [Spongiibacter sp.]
MSDSTPRLWAVVPAAGKGSRFGADCPKQYLDLGNAAVIEHSLHALLAEPRIATVVVALRGDDSHFQQLAVSRNSRVRAVQGGAERADSVELALASIAQDAGERDWVLVHDAARPCLSGSDLSRLIEECLARDCGGILAQPMVDTVKRANDRQQVVETVDRTVLWRAQTPQMFPLADLFSALADCRKRGVLVTDEASAIEATGGHVAIIQGSHRNIKITHREDLALAEFFLNELRVEGDSP